MFIPNLEVASVDSNPRTQDTRRTGCRVCRVNVHARTGPDTQRAQAHNHTQNSNPRTHPRQTSRSHANDPFALGQQSTARRATQHAEAERRRDLCDVVPTSPVHTTFARPVTVQAGDTERVNGSHCFHPPEITLSRDPSASSVSLRIVALPAVGCGLTTCTISVLTALTATLAPSHRS